MEVRCPPSAPGISCVISQLGMHECIHGAPSSLLPHHLGFAYSGTGTVIVTYKKGTYRSVKSFERTPTWDEVTDPVTDMFKGEYTVEDPVFKADEMAVERETWAKFADGKTEIELTVRTCRPKSLLVMFE